MSNALDRLNKISTIGSSSATKKSSTTTVKTSGGSDALSRLNNVQTIGGGAKTTAPAQQANPISGEAWTRAKPSQTVIPQAASVKRARIANEAQQGKLNDLRMQQSKLTAKYGSKAYSMPEYISLSDQIREADKLTIGTKSDLKAAKSAAKDAFESDARVAPLRKQLDTAMSTNNLKRVIEISDQLRSIRAEYGAQTIGDRVNDTLSAALNYSGAMTANVAGFAANTVQDPVEYQRKIKELENTLKTGRDINGFPVSQKKLDTIPQEIADLNAKIKASQSGTDLTGKIYGKADELNAAGQKSEEAAKAGLGKVGTTLVDAGMSTVQSGADALVGLATGTGMLPFAVRSFGGSTMEARNAGASLQDQFLYGGAEAAKELFTEKLFGMAMPQKLLGKAGRGGLDGIVEKGIRNVTDRIESQFGQRAVGGLLTWLSGGVSEGTEEVIGGLIENTLINPHLKGFDPDTRTMQEKFEDGLYDFIVGAVSGMLIPTNLVTYSPNGTAATTEETAAPATAEDQMRAAAMETAQNALRESENSAVESATARAENEAQARTAPKAAMSEADAELNANVEAGQKAATNLGAAGSEAFRRTYTADVAQNLDAATAYSGYTAVYDAVRQGRDMTEAEHQRAAQIPGEMFQAATKAAYEDISRAKQAKYFGKSAGLVRNAALTKARMTRREEMRIDAAAKLTGVAVEMVDDLRDANGNRVNASYENGKIQISLQSENPAMTAFTHEIVHRIREVNSEAYSALADFVSKGIRAKETEAEIRYMASYDTTNIDEVSEEIVADAFGKMLNDGDYLSQFVQDNRTAAQKLVDFVHDFVEQVRRMVRNKDLQLTRDQMSVFSELENLAGEMENILSGAISSTAEIVDANTTLEEGGTVTEDGKDVATSDGNGHTVFSRRTWRESGRDVYSQFLAKQVEEKNLTKAEAADMIKQIDSIYKMTDEFTGKYAPFGTWSEAEVDVDGDGNPVFSVVKANGDYALNLDFSLVCKKRRTLDAVFNALIKDGLIDEFDMGQESIAAINDIIRANDFETACALCFVDSKRYRVAMIADAFTAQYNKLVRSMVPKGSAFTVDYHNFGGNSLVQNTGTGIDTLDDSQLDFTSIDKVLATAGSKTVDYKIANYLKNNPSGRKFVMRGDFISTAGFDELNRSGKDILGLYNSKKGAGGPKASQSDVQYLNEIIADRKFNATSAYAVGGVRIQSFSDYVPRMVFDYVQMVGDLAAKNLPAHAYTKELLFAQQFGKTGVKINMSLVPDIIDGGVAPGLDKEGNYAWRDGQSFGSTEYTTKGKRLTAKQGFELACRIQKAAGYSENCGTIAVGVSSQHILKMLDDPNIRMIIPYHKSSLNHIIAVMTNIDKYTDYTKVQNTRDANGNKITGADFNFNQYMIDNNCDAKTAADAYLAWCKEHDYIAKFDEFADHENYYKLLEDFNCYDAVSEQATPQRGVRPVYPTDGDAFGSMKDLIEAGLEEDALLQARQDKQVPDIVDQIKRILPGMEKKWRDDRAAKAAKRKSNKAKQTAKNSRSIKSLEESADWYYTYQQNGNTMYGAPANQDLYRNAEQTAAELDKARRDMKQQAADNRRAVKDAKLAGMMAQGRKDAAAYRRAQESLDRVKQQRADEIRARKEKRFEQQWKKAESEARTKLLHVAQRLERLKTTQANRALIDQLIGDLDTVSKGMTGKTLNDLQALQDWYNEQKQNPDFIADPATEKKLERLKKKHIADMDIQDVVALNEVLRNIENQIRTQNEFVESQIRHDTYKAGEAIIQDVESVKGTKKNVADLVVTNTLSPVRAIRRMVGYNDGSPLKILADELANGQRKMIDYQMRAEKLFSKWTNDQKFIDSLRGKKNADRVTVQGFDNKTGEAVDVQITKDMRMALYLHSLNDQNKRHIAEGGITIPDLDLLNKGQIAEAYARGTTIKMQPSVLNGLFHGMSAEERAFANAASRYFNGMSREEINGVSEKLVGYSIAGVENYFPINTDTRFSKKEFDSLKRDGTIEGMGFLKERKNAKNPIMLRGMTDVLNQSIGQHAKYVGLAIPVRNFGKVWSVTTAEFLDDGDVNHFTASVQKAIESKWGSRATGYIEKMMTDLQNGGKSSEELDHLLAKARSNYAGAVLTLNAGVALKQAASYPTAAAVLGWKPLAQAMGNVGKVDLKVIEKYTPLLWYRSKGFSTQELGDINARGKSLPKALNWIQAMDIATTEKLWKASEYYVRDYNKNLKVGTDDYYKAVAEVYNRVIEETQPNYTTMQRPQLLRSDSSIVQSLSMFKTQPFQNFNVLYDAAENYKAKKGTSEAKAAKADLTNAVTSQIVQTAVFAAMTAVWNAIRKRPDKYEDEDGEVTFESVMTGILKDMAAGAVSMIPGGSDVYSFASSIVTGDKYYGVESVSISAVNDLLDATIKMAVYAKDMVEDARSGDGVDIGKYGRKMVKPAEQIAQGFGVPAANVMNMFDAAFHWATTAYGGKYLGEYEYLSLTTSKSDPSKYYNLLFSAKQNSDEDYKALLALMEEDGFDMEKVDAKMKDMTKKSSAFQTASKEVLKERSDQMQSTRQYENFDAKYQKKADDWLKKYTNAEALADADSDYPMMDVNLRVKESHIEPWEYALFMAALSMQDDTNKDPKKRNGSYDTDEKVAAIKSISGLSTRDMAEIFEINNPKAKNNPFK